jgi:predicted AlkP superfamily phosphohydrolase/phosphomutase
MKLDRILIAATLCVLAAAAIVGALKWKGGAATPPPVVTEPGTLSLLVVGVEGLEPSIIERLTAEGKLPNISRLLAEGASVRFPSLGRDTDMRISWTSLVTGVTPERQGVGAMRQSVKGNMVPLPLKPSSRTVDTVWTVLSKAGRDVAVLGWPGTWPVEQVKGLMVGPYATYVLDRTHGQRRLEAVYPPEAYAGVDSLIRTADSYRRADLGRFVNADSALGLEAVAGYNLEVLVGACAADTTMLSIARAATTERGATALFVSLPGLDLVSQRFWVYMDPQQLPKVEADERGRKYYEQLIEALGGTIPSYYEYVDEILGSLLGLVGEGGTVAIVTDHGYDGISIDASGNPGFGKRMHSTQGLLVLSGPRVSAGARVNDATLFDVAPTIMEAASIPLPAGLDGRAVKGVLR